MLKDDLIPYLPQLKDRTLTNRQVADLLHASEYHLCRVLKELGLSKIKSKSQQLKDDRQLRQLRKEYREQLAKTQPVQKAAALAGVHQRTIYRDKAKCKTTD